LKITKNYNEKGNLNETYFFYNTQPNLNCKSEYKYNEKGNKIKYSIYDLNADLRKQEIYDEKGNKLKELVFPSKNIISHEITYKYDNYNNIIDKINICVMDNKIIVSSYKYEYDVKGNWIKKLTILKASQWLRITKVG